MSEIDRARYDELMSQERTDADMQELSALNAKYSRAIDELAVVISRDSGAMLLANTYLQTYDESAGYKEKNYKLSAIRCVADTSLTVENLEIEGPGQQPGDVVLLTWDIVNNGLLPATDYHITAYAEADGGNRTSVLDWMRNDPGSTIYPGVGKDFRFEWQLPEYEETLVLTMEVTEQNPTTGATDYETTNSATLTLETEFDLVLGAPYGRTAIEYAERALLNHGDHVLNYQVEEETAHTDREYLALLHQYGDAAGILNAYNAAGDDDITGDYRFFYVFVPALNNSSGVLANLTFTVTSTESDRVMGETNVAFLDAEENRLIPVLAPVRHSEIGNLGVIEANVTVTDENGDVLDAMPVTMQLLDNISLEVTATGQNASKLQKLEGVSEFQLGYQARLGDSVVGTEEWLELADDDPNCQAKRIDLKVGESIQMDSQVFPHDSLKRVDFEDLSYTLWISEKEDPGACISVTSDGKVTAIAPGVGMIYASDENSAYKNHISDFANEVQAEVGSGLAIDIAGSILIDRVAVFVTGEETGEKNPVTISDGIKNETVEASVREAAAGETVTVTLAPDEGYKADGVTVTDANGNTVAVTDNGDGTYTFTMPASAVTVTPSFIPDNETTNPVNLPENTANGTVQASTEEAAPGETVTLILAPEEGYQVDSVSVTDADGNPVKLTNNGDGTYTFIVPESAVTVNATFARKGSSGGGGGSAGVTTHAVNLPDTLTGGTVTASSKQATPGRTVTITVTPEEGYETASVTVTDNKGNAIEVKDNGDGAYSFTMPNSPVTVTPEFTKTGETTKPEGNETESSGCPKDSSCPISAFTDANPKA